MNDRQLEKKVRQDAARVKKDFNILVEDGVARFSRLGNNVNQATGKAKEGIATWMEDGVSQMSEGFEKMAGDTRESMVDTATMVKKDVGHRLSQYNAKAQEYAAKVPGGIGEKAAKYPWVSISIALVFGMLLGAILKRG